MQKQLWVTLKIQRRPNWELGAFRPIHAFGSFTHASRNGGGTAQRRTPVHFFGVGKYVLVVPSRWVGSASGKRACVSAGWSGGQGLQLQWAGHLRAVSASQDLVTCGCRFPADHH